MEIDVFPKDVDVTIFGHTFWIRETYLTSLLLIAFILVIALIIKVCADKAVYNRRAQNRQGAAFMRISL